MRRTDSERDGDKTPDSGRQSTRPAFSTRVFMFWIVGITVFLLAFTLGTGRPPSVLPLFVFLPAFVAGVGTVRQTVIAAIWITVVTGALFIYTDGLRENLLAMVLIVVFGALSVVACRYRMDRDAEIIRLRSVAAALQERILRPFPLRTDHVVVNGLYRPVEEDSLVGGDIYEVLDTPYGTRLLIADVQGKGIPSVGAAFAVLEAFRGAAYREPDLIGVVNDLENAVVRYNTFAEQNSEPERFVTALILNIDDTQKILAVDAGHIPPHVLYANGGVEELRYEPGVPLGLDSLASEPRTVERFDFPPDSILLLCTDGVIEARSPDGDFYPLEERLRSWEHVDPARTAERLSADLRRFTGDNFRDDIAVLTMSRNGKAVTAT